MKASAKEWIQFADKDLQAALIMLDHENIRSIAAFHCQQAVEKCLKALLEERELDVPKTHDLEKLAARVEVGWGIAFEDERLLVLNTVYIESRYPGGLGLLPSGQPSSDEALDLFYFASDLKSRVLKILG